MRYAERMAELDEGQRLPFYEVMAHNLTANWVGVPVALLTVPAAFACYDALKMSRLPAGWYAARSLLEVAVLVPLWAYVWVAFGESSCSAGSALNRLREVAGPCGPRQCDLP